VVFRSLRTKLLTLMITLSLLPLTGMAVFSYFIGSQQIQNNIRLSLEKMAQDTADKVFFLLREKGQEIDSMAGTFPLIYPSLKDNPKANLTGLLNTYCFNHDTYDLLMVLDGSGDIVAINTQDRDGNPLPAGPLARIMKTNIKEFPEEKKLFNDSITGLVSHHDWYRSRLVEALYDYRKEDQSHQYDIAYSEPIRNPRTLEIVGVWINIVNWSYIQQILDNVEMDLAKADLRSGYAFMIAGDADTIIGHKYRLNRRLEEDASRPTPQLMQGLYGTKLIENHGLQNLHDAIVRQSHSLAYQFPKGNDKISGLAPVGDNAFAWTIGVGVDGADIFRHIRILTGWLLGVAVFLAALVIVFTFVISGGIIGPLKNLIRSAQTIAQGNLSERVKVRTSDEVGILGSTFNDMAQALSERETELQELNKNLELMVRERTNELENSHEALKRAYLDLQNTQEQLVQTEKMASLGQLVAGIAHEIKNPLNFIYGNTGFLADYTQKLQLLLASFEKLSSLSEADRTEMERQKEIIHYDFIREDLKTLIDNFTEGARRINAIVSDLRTFSRMDTDAISEIDLHASLEMSLNLLRNQYRNRIEVHREYGDIPKIQGYAGKLSQVFMNLLSNAFHAVHEKGDVWIRTRSSNGTVEVEIEDNGAGIAREHLKRIFEPFFTTKPVGQGTGLGLSISYGIIEQHHGRIHVASAPQKGSTFTVRLPIFLEKGVE
jgi:signal transduction histidine kinase